MDVITCVATPKAPTYVTVARDTSLMAMANPAEVFFSSFQVICEVTAGAWGKKF